MYKFLHISEIPNVSSEPDCDIILEAAIWGNNFVNHYLDNIQRNHQLCLSKIEHRYEYVILTRREDYERNKERFIIPNITFIFFDDSLPKVLASIHMEYAYYRKKPWISMAADCLHTVNIIPNILTKYAHNDICCVMSQRVYHQILDAIKVKEAQVPYENIFVPREFLKLVFPHLYVTDKRYFMDDYRAMGCYNGFFWTVRRDGILIGELMRTFHWGVMYIKNPVLGMESCANPTWGLDPSPFLINLAKADTVGVVADSDDGFCVDVMMDYNINAPDPQPKLMESDYHDIVRYWQSCLNGHGICEVNEAEMGINVAIHSEPLDQSWVELANTANDFITKTYGGVIKNKELTWRMLE